MKYFVIALCLAVVGHASLNAKPIRPVRIPGHIRGLVKQTAEERAEGHNRALLKANATKANGIKQEPMMDATKMSPKEAQELKVKEFREKAKKEKDAKLRATANNMTRKDMDCLKCSTNLCPYLAGFCSGMCGMPCVPGGFR